MWQLRLTTSLSVLVLLLGPVAAFAAPVRTAAQGADDITCADFVRQVAAQALLEADDTYAEVLDADGDGVACNEDGVDRPSGNPLRARLGGNREGFEDEYGAPTDEENEDTYPIGVAYEVEGFAGVSVFYHRTFVIYITLTAADDTPWSQPEAEEIARGFLPADWEAGGQPIETEDGDLLVPGHSQALETRLSATTYQRYGAQGEQGDVYVLLRLNADNDVAAIELGLGNDVQLPPDEAVDDGGDDEQDPEAATPEAETPAVEPTEAATEEATDQGDGDGDAQAYLQDVRSQFDTLQASVDEFLAILNDPNFVAGDEALFNRLLDILVLWTSASANADALTPPAEFSDLHQTFLDYTELLSGAAVDLAAGLRGDQASLTAGDEKLGQAIELQPVIEELLVQAGV